MGAVPFPESLGCRRECSSPQAPTEEAKEDAEVDLSHLHGPAPTLRPSSAVVAEAAAPCQLVRGGLEREADVEVHLGVRLRDSETDWDFVSQTVRSRGPRLA